MSQKDLWFVETPLVRAFADDLACRKGGVAEHQIIILMNDGWSRTYSVSITDEDLVLLKLMAEPYHR